MNIQTYAKINIWITQIITFIVKMALFCSIIMCPIVIFADLSVESFWFWISCICYLLISCIVLNLINNQFNIIQRFLTIPDNKKFILSILLASSRSKRSLRGSIQLNSELDKLSKTIES